ncbi:MAG: Tol-Pal system protein TolB [Acetobacteraceae bacterium]|nr:Tol-Pal system protein TolB [Acetobacteraceae bacterium]
MTHLDGVPLLARRGLIGAAGAVSLLAAAPALAQAPSAVIDVNRARAAPIPIAITDLSGADPASAALGRDIAQVITADLGGSGLFRPISQAAFIHGPAGAGGTPDFQNWAAIGAQALVTGTVQVSGPSMRVEFRLWDVLPRAQLQGTAYTSSSANWRRIAHIMADVIYERLLGEKGYFDTRIAYVSATGPRGRQVRRLAIMDQDGANQRQLTDGAWMVLTPRFAPVRDQLAFMSYANNRPRVYLLDLASGRQSALGDFNGMTFAPRFSPDGGRVIMSLAQDAGSDIVVVDLASRATRRLTHSDSIDVSPCYSPDGTQIVFNSDRGGDQQLYVMGADGGAARRISFGAGRYATPVWSPRGDLIAFTRFGGGAGGFDIGVMHPDGSGERILAQGWEVEGPCFAPNGRVMVFFSQSRAADSTGAGFSSRLVSVDITGFNQRPIPTPTDATDPAWSPLGG